MSSTGNTGAYIWDNTTSSWVNGSSYDYQTNLYLYTSHSYNVYVYGYTTGGSYTVTVQPGYGSGYSSGYDGDSSDFTTSDYIYPSYSGYQSGSGHTDSYGDVDYGSLYLSSSGYYTVSSTGNTGAYIWDNTTSSWVNGSSYDYQTNLYLYTSHSYNVYV